MKQLPKNEKIKLLSRIVWGVNEDPEVMLQIIDGRLSGTSYMTKPVLYRRLLTSCDWYTLLKIVPNEKMAELLDDEVLHGLFPEELKKKYQYARSVLYR